MNSADLIDFALCVTSAYDKSAEVHRVRVLSTVTLPTGETVWDTMEICLSNTPLADCFTMRRRVRFDGKRTLPEEHLCAMHDGALCTCDCITNAMVAMCRWKNENVIRNPVTWSFFSPYHSICQQQRSAPGRLKFSIMGYIRWCIDWGLLCPDRVPLPQTAADDTEGNSRCPGYADINRNIRKLDLQS